jgi:hypothetical protein
VTDNNFSPKYKGNLTTGHYPFLAATAAQKVHLSLCSFMTPLKEVKGLQVCFKFASSLLQE